MNSNKRSHCVIFSTSIYIFKANKHLYSTFSLSQNNKEATRTLVQHTSITAKCLTQNYNHSTRRIQQEAPREFSQSTSYANMQNHCM